MIFQHDIADEIAKKKSQVPKTQDFLHKGKPLSNLLFVILFIVIKEAYKNLHIFPVTVDII